MSTQIVGRAEETAEMEAAIDRLLSSGRTLVTVEGQAGIGKSRLLDHTLAEARRRRVTVASAKAQELEQTRPFGLMVRLLAELAPPSDTRRRRIAAILDPERHGGDGATSALADPGLQFKLIDAIGDLVEDVALSGPLLLGIDDLQWADPSSLLALGTIAGRVQHLPVAVVVLLRPIPRRPELIRLLASLADAGARRLELRSLEPAAVADLAGELLGAEPGPSLCATMAKAAGNPLFIIELLDALDDDGAIDIVGGCAEVSEPMLSPTLRMTILRRLVFLSEPAVELLRAASILGTDFTVTDLTVTMSSPAIDLLPAVEEAISARLLDEVGERLRFHHDLIRDAVYEELPVSARRALHREAGRRLAAAGGAVQQVAEQLSRGASTGDTEAIGWLLAAARDVGRTSSAAAAELFQRALDLMAPGDPNGEQVRLELATSLLLSGRIAEAADRSRALSDAASDAHVCACARVCLGHALLAEGRGASAGDELRAAAATGALAPAEAANAMAWGSVAALFVGDLAGAEGLATKARDRAIDAGEAISTSVAINVQACAQQMSARLHTALETIDDAVRRADQSTGRIGHRYPLHLGRGHILIDLDRLDEARAALDVARRTSEAMGLRWPLASLHTLIGMERFVHGAWDDAVVALQSSLDLADETGERLGVVLSRAVIALVHLHRNELAGARAIIMTGRRELEASAGNPLRANWVRWAHALVLEADGEEAAALDELAACWDECRLRGLAYEYATFGPDLVRLAVAAGQADRAREVSDAVAGVAALNVGVHSMRGAALRCRGLVDDDPDALGRAADALRRGPRALDAALAAEDAGVAALRHGRVAEARALLDDAGQRYQQLEATRDVLRVDAALRAAGFRRGRRGRRSRPAYGWGSLTPTERTVAELAADGLSNPQIGDRLYVSHRTVQTHLSHIFTKLDLTSRVQLTAEVTRRHLADP